MTSEISVKTQDINRLVSFAIIAWVLTFCITYSFLNVYSPTVTVSVKSATNRLSLQGKVGQLTYQQRKELLRKQDNKLDLASQLKENADSKELVNKVRILCWIMTSPNSHWKAKVVRDTWGRRCNILVFVSSEYDPTLPSVKVNLTEDSRQTLWGKTKQGFQYVYRHYRDQADWFVKADDDTYMIVENLRYMLKTHLPTEPVWFGCKFKVIVPSGYMSGGAGYVLSREALNRFVENALENKPLHAGEQLGHCKTKDDTGAEDAEMGFCLESVGVKAGDSRDLYEKYTFFPFDPATHVSIQGNRAAPYWYWNNIAYPNKIGMPECCSNKAIAFHYIKPNQMKVLEYLIYHLRPASK